MSSPHVSTTTPPRPGPLPGRSAAVVVRGARTAIPAFALPRTGSGS